MKLKPPSKSAVWKRKRVALGLCTQCGQAVEAERVGRCLCAACRDKAAVYMRGRYVPKATGRVCGVCKQGGHNVRTCDAKEFAA